MSAMNDVTPYKVPQEPGRWRAMSLAALVHLALLAFLWIGVRWQNETPTTIEAEVWSPQPREAAPQPQPDEETPRAPEPKPVVREEPREIPKPPAVERPLPNPDIALEQEKKRKALEKKRLEEELAKQKKLEQEHLAQKEREEREAKLKKEQEELAKKKEKEHLAKLEAEKQQRLEKEKAAKDKAEKEKKAAEAKRKQEAEDKMMAKLRDDEMRRLAGGVTGTGGHGEASQSQGGRADSGYAGRVAAKIKSNIVFSVPEGLMGNSPVEYEVNLLPDGSIAGMKKIRSSGVPGFDEAVRRAIEKSQPYPKDKSGSVPSSFIGTHRPKDQ